MSENLIRRLWREHVLQYWWVLLIAAGLMTLEGATLGAISYLMRPLFDEVFMAEAGAADAVRIGLIISGIFLLRAVSGYAQRYMMVGIGLNVTTALQSRLVGHLLTLDARFFQDHAPGALIERVRGDTLTLQGTASSAIMTLGRDTISVISLIAVMLWNDWVWTLLALLGVPILVGPIIWVSSRIKRRTRSARATAARLSTQLDEIFHGMVSIKVNRLEAHETRRFGDEVRRFLRAQRSAERGRAVTPALIDLIAAAGFLAVVSVGGAQIAGGEKSIGTFMSFFTALALLFDPLRRLGSVYAALAGAMASLERLYAVLDARPTILPPARPVPPAAGDVTFDDVHFAYDATPVLRGLTFTAEEGKTTALVGPSGAGKSTVFNLLTRLVEPQAGRVAIGGVSVADMDTGALRDRIALVGQETALFDETIAQNIRLGRLDAREDEVRAAAEAASVLEFAEGLPDGLATRVGPRGSALSGGQRQRVAIARAMLKGAPILLLDEPTSALDARSEQLVQEALDRLSAGRTTLVVAHRLATVKAADKIVVLEAGQAVETGTHATLLGRDGAYAGLHRLQVGGLRG